MSSEKIDLMGAIDALITERTFSMEAVQAIANLKDKAASLEALLEKERAISESHYSANSKLRDENAQLNYKLAKAKETIEELQTEIEKMKPAQYEAEKQAAVAETWEKAFLIVFKPNTVRESVSKSIPLVQQYQGGGSSITYQSETAVTDREG